MTLNTAVISGASDGIGAAFSKVLIQNGWEVIAISRSKDKLNNLKCTMNVNKENFKPFPCDVMDLSGLKFIAEEINRPNLIFLNAGIYSPIDASQSNIDIYRDHINVNYLGVLNCYEAFLPKMLLNKKGQIIIMSSVSGWIGLPKAAAYGPTKAALRSFGQSIRYDLIDKGIKVQVCSPGFVQTSATSLNDFYMPGLMKVDTAAALIYKNMKSKKFEFSFPLFFSFFMRLFSIIPDRLSSYLIKKIIV
ncbi:SDR family NAD(P)-dependent oxidoreductase [Alphaproteobacteria bacterium]|nr:SDR family NAD(P)-dependent oxidoreductase [Alphaproteobacteria bacterium]